jgi:hypothetical protein
LTAKSEFVHDHAELEDTAAGAPVLLGDPDLEELGLRQGFLDVPGVFLEAVVLPGVGQDGLAPDLTRPIAPFETVLGEQVIHREDLQKLGRRKGKGAF